MMSSLTDARTAILPSVPGATTPVVEAFSFAPCVRNGNVAVGREVFGATPTYPAAPEG